MKNKNNMMVMMMLKQKKHTKQQKNKTQQQIKVFSSECVVFSLVFFFFSVLFCVCVCFFDFVWTGCVFFLLAFFPEKQLIPYPPHTPRKKPHLGTFLSPFFCWLLFLLLLLFL